MAQRKYLDFEGLTELVAKFHEKYGKAFQWKNSVANVAALPTIASLTKDNVGNVYNIQAAGKTTADFVEGTGKSLPANSNVVLTNMGDDETPVLKWDVIGVFDISDKLTFGDEFPSSPDEGDVFLYMGATTYTYNAVSDPSGNPQAQGWYVQSGSDYVATTDTTVQTGTTYYTKDEQYVTGVIYKYDGSDWVGQSAGDVMVPISTAEVDSLFA